MAPSKAKPPKSAAINTSSSVLTRLISFDTSLSLLLHDSFQPIIPRSVLRSLEISGDGRFWFPVPISLLLSSYFYFTPTSHHQGFTPFLIALLLGSLLDLLLVGLVKHLVRRPRPVYNKGMHLVFAADHWSFPSGHSSRVFFIASFLYLCSEVVKDGLRILEGWGLEDRWYFGRLAIFVWAAATSASRVLLGRHFLLDVLTGACLGVLEGLLVFYLFQYYISSLIF